MDGSPGAIAVHRFLKEVVAFHGLVWGDVPYPSVSEPDEAGSPDSSREQMLNSLYQRTFQSVPPQYDPTQSPHPERRTDGVS